jgi:hypothetical protein
MSDIIRDFVKKLIRWYVVLVWLSSCTGCTGALVANATDTAIAIAKIPFKVGGAVVDLIIEEEESDTEE